MIGGFFSDKVPFNEQYTSSTIAENVYSWVTSSEIIALDGLVTTATELHLATERKISRPNAYIPSRFVNCGIDIGAALGVLK